MNINITNKVVESYVDSLYKAANEELAQLRAFAKENHVPVILEDTEGLLLNLLRIKKPEALLEVGTAIGYSACTFVSGCGCHVTTVELDHNMADIARTNIKAFGFEDKIDVIEGDASDVLEDLNAKGRKFDVFFLDAAKSHYRHYFDLCVEMSNNDALIICDNVLMKGMTASDEFDTRKRYKTSIRHMRNFLDYINTRDYAQTCVLPLGDGVSLSVISKNE